MTEFERIRQKYQGEAQKRSNSIALAKARIQGLEAQVKALNAELEAKGITVTPEVRAMIEAAVQELDIAIDGAIGALGDIFIEDETEIEDDTEGENT